MIDKVVYLSYQPLTSKFYKDFYIQNCIDENIIVEYWDMSKLFFPKLDFGESLYSEIIITINAYKELKIYLSKVEKSKTLFIVHINYRFNVIRLFVLLTRFSCKLAFMGRGALPTVEKKMKSKIWEIFSKIDIYRLYRVIGAKIAEILKKLKIVKTYDVIFMAGSEGYNIIGSGYKLDHRNAEIIEINYYDYDLYLTSLNVERKIKDKYCVFLDEYLPYHPDFEITNTFTIAAEMYYPFCNKYFDFVEEKYNLKVIIAAHPKAIKYKTENPFSNREIVFNKTCQLVKDSEFVMTGHSTSISFALFFNKPIVFLTSNTQKDKMYLEYRFTCYLARILNCQINYLDSFIDVDVLTHPIDIEKYEEYKYKYLTSKKAENKISSEIFIDSILKL